MNYFNYFTEIEDAFVRRRGKHLFLSPMDWALMETWKETGIPLHIVLRGVERSFDSFEAKPRKRSVKSLLYCQEEVEAQYAEWLESRVGANPASEKSSTDDSKTPFNSTAIRDHLNLSRKTLVELADARLRNINEELTEALTRSVSLLEDSLTGLERMLSQALLSAVSTTELETAKKELQTQLKPYRSHMDKAVYNQTVENLVLKRFREQFGIPRLSLFYL